MDRPLRLGDRRLRQHVKYCTVPVTYSIDSSLRIRELLSHMIKTINMREKPSIMAVRLLSGTKTQSRLGAQTMATPGLLREPIGSRTRENIMQALPLGSPAHLQMYQCFPRKVKILPTIDEISSPCDDYQPTTDPSRGRPCDIHWLINRPTQGQSVRQMPCTSGTVLSRERPAPRTQHEPWRSRMLASKTSDLMCLRVS